MSIGIVGKNMKFEVFDERQTSSYLSRIEGEERRSTRPSDDEPRPQGDQVRDGESVPDADDADNEVPMDTE